MIFYQCRHRYLQYLTVLLFLLLLGYQQCSKSEAAPANEMLGKKQPTTSLKGSPTPAVQHSAELATHYRQGLCKSMQASLLRLRQDQTVQQAQLDLTSLRFILRNMLGAYPINSVAPDSKLKPSALEHPDRIAMLEDKAAQSVTEMASATNPDALRRARQHLTDACMACHAEITQGVRLMGRSTTSLPVNQP